MSVRPLGEKVNFSVANRAGRLKSLMMIPVENDNLFYNYVVRLSVIYTLISFIVFKIRFMKIPVGLSVRL